MRGADDFCDQGVLILYSAGTKIFWNEADEINLSDFDA